MRRLEKLEARRLDTMVRASMANEVYKSIRESESVRYAIGAMQPLDPEYTKNTFSQGERVRSQLEQRLATACDYEYQGSVTTDTHIKARSDIDLLAIRRGWLWLEPPQPAVQPYAGDPAEDMRSLRRQIGAAAAAAFPAVEVDESKATCIRLCGGSLTREVDVVPASWFDTNDFARTKDSVHRGVKVFNKDSDAFVANTPRLHKHRIEERDRLTRGGLRKAARLLKTLMYDSDGRVDMSSYNIVGIAYNIPERSLVTDAPRDLAVLEACFEYCSRLEHDPTLRAAIQVPDGHRAVFGDAPGATKPQLMALTKEIADLRRDILNENVRSFTKLVEANVPYSVPVRT